MIVSFRLTIIGFIAVASSAAAVPPDIIPPEPALLAAAQRLMHALPLKDAVGDGFATSGITSEVADNAVAWFASQQHQSDESLKSIFYEKVKAESRAQIPAAIEDARGFLAERYAHRLSEQELKGAETFALTHDGEAFFSAQLAGDIALRNLVSGFMYQRLFPDLPRIWQAARESNQILKAVNRKK